MASAVFVVITTINEPTPAVRGFCRIPGHRVVVVGDRKTPANWRCPPAVYLGPEASAGRLAAALPWNHYSRKMLGYLHAIRLGADVIYDTDDDNVPKPEWDIPPFDGVYDATREDLGFVNLYASFTDQRIWPRGFPLPRIRDVAGVVPDAALTPQAAQVGVWQALADGEPDVDAIYRLVDGAPCAFRSRAPIVLGVGTVCPFNTQSTAVRRALFPLLYLPSTVTFRFTDILRGLVAQPIMWAAGYRLGFTQATVVQERNPHKLLADFADEVPMYLHAEEVPDRVSRAIRPDASVAENLTRAYAALADARIVTAAESDRLSAWLDDLTPAAAGPT